MYIGGVSDSDNIFISSPFNSTAPVSISLFGDCLLTISPVTAMQYSDFTLSDFSKASLFISSPKTICIIPVLSLKSTNIKPPKFLFL